MIDIEDVKRLTVGPNDILVVQVKGHISRKMADTLKETLGEGYPGLKNKIMVVDSDVSLAVMVAEEDKMCLNRSALDAAIDEFVAAGADRETVTIIPDCDHPDRVPSLRAEIGGVMKERRPDGILVDCA